MWILLGSPSSRNIAYKEHKGTLAVDGQLKMVIIFTTALQFLEMVSSSPTTQRLTATFQTFRAVLDSVRH